MTEGSRVTADAPALARLVQQKSKHPRHCKMRDGSLGTFSSVARNNARSRVVAPEVQGPSSTDEGTIEKCQPGNQISRHLSAIGSTQQALHRLRKYPVAPLASTSSESRMTGAFVVSR